MTKQQTHTTRQRRQKPLSKQSKSSSASSSCCRKFAAFQSKQQAFKSKNKDGNDSNYNTAELSGRIRSSGPEQHRERRRICDNNKKNSNNTQSQANTKTSTDKPAMLSELPVLGLRPVRQKCLAGATATTRTTRRQQHKIQVQLQLQLRLLRLLCLKHYLFVATTRMQTLLLIAALMWLFAVSCWSQQRL